jgi:alkylhydroperoxidase family enzyme
VTQEQLEAIAEYETSTAFDDAERVALRLADAMVGTPAQIPQALFVELRQFFSENQLVELASTIAWENYRARFNRVFDVGSEGYSEGAFCPLPVGEG